MKYIITSFVIFTFLACDDSSTGPGKCTGDKCTETKSTPFEGCWVLNQILKKEKSTGKETIMDIGTPDSLYFKKDTTYIWVLSTASDKKDWGVFKWDSDSLYLQSQDNLANFKGYNIRLSNDSLSFLPDEKLDEFYTELYKREECEISL